MKARKILSVILTLALLFGEVYMAVPETVAAGYNEYRTETNTGKLNMVPWNNDALKARLATGAWADPVVMDYNGDGYMDLVVSGSAVVYNGTMVFYGSADSVNDESENYLLMDKGRILTSGMNYLAGSYIYDENGNYQNTVLTYDDKVFLDFTSSQSADYQLQKIALPSTIDGHPASSAYNSAHTFVDIDSDGKHDLVRYYASWEEYGWNGKFDSEGNWGTGSKDVDSDGDGDPIHGWVLWAKNTSEYDIDSNASYGDAQIIKVEKEDGTKAALEVFGFPCSRFWDFDNDGDLDIICGHQLDFFTYFENISDVKGSNLNSEGEFLCAEGRVIKAADGDKTENLENVVMEQCMLRVTSFDWNNDGFMDLIVGEEDGSVSLIENTGLFDADKTPIFKQPQYFLTPADSLKVGILNTPFSVDWDGDGDEDIITGDAAGFYSFIENTTPKGEDLTNPSFAEAIRFVDESGTVIRRLAGYNGSVQGPAEAKWGYTVPTVADWDNDGTLDLVCNDIWGKILWYRGIPGETTKLEHARAVEVEWENGAKYPSYNWWVPEGNELATYWRTTAWAQDLNGDGLCDLTVCDHEGYMAFFERYEEDGVLKLKEGKRIFYDSDGGLIKLAYGTGLDGANNRSKFCLVDWNGDQKLDLIRNDTVSACYFVNVAENEGEYKFEKARTMYNRTIAYHTSCPAVCDWNGDGKPDLLVGAEDGHFYYLHRDFADTETVSEKLREHLVTSFDFEGTNPLADKANKGEAEDNLSVINPEKVEIKNGVAKISGNGALSAAHSADILSDEMTIFFKAKLSGSIADSPVLISKGDSSPDAESRAYDVFVNYNKLVASITSRNEGVNFNNYELSAGHASIGAATLTEEEMKGENAMPALSGAFKNNKDSYPTLTVFSKTEEEGGEDTETETGSEVWSATGAVTAPTKGAGTDGDPIKIETAEQLAYVIKNGGGDGVYYRLENDIYLNDPTKINWANGERTDDNYTIRRWYDRNNSAHFKGHIDGNGHIVYGLYAVESLDGYFEHATIGGGLVSIVASGKAVSFKNIGIESAYVDNGCNTGAFIGFMWGDGSSAKFDRCFVGENVTVIGQNAAAFVGATTTGVPKISISNSYSLATLINKGTVNSYTGLVGDSWIGNVNVTNSYNAKGHIYKKNAYPHEDVAVNRSSDDLTVGAWREYAYVVKRGTDGYLDTYLYVSNADSTDSEDDYILLSSVTNTKITHINESAADLIIGNNSLLEDFAAERIFDHIAIYDTAFSPAELMGILPYNQNNNLVAKWNFNGQTDEERLADTAFGGETDDNLTLKGDSGVIRFEDGQAIISGNGALATADSADLSQTGAMTVYFRVKLSGTLQEFGFIEKRSFAGVEPWGNSRSFGILNYPNGKYTVQTNTDNLSISSTSPVVDVWREVAFILERQDTGKLVQSLYVSTVENPTAAADFQKVCTSTVSGNALNDTDVPLYIGNDVNLKSKTVTRAYDEVRIYSATLGLKEVADIVPDEEIKPSHLVAKWTFSGEGDDKLKDTADEGTVADNLTVIGADGNVSISKGIAKITGNGALQAADSVDLSQTENMTLFFRMKLEGALQDFSFVDKRSFSSNATYGNSRAYGVFYYSNQIGAATNSTGYYTGKSAETDLWREYALVITKTSDTTLNQTLYVSTVENPTKDSDFTAIVNQTVQSGSINDTAVPLIIGNDIHMRDRSFTRYVDEVRLYDTNLSKSQLAEIEIEQSCTRAELSELAGRVEYAENMVGISEDKMGAFTLALSSANSHVSSGSNDTVLGAELYTSLEAAYKELLIPGDVNASGKLDACDLVYLNFVMRGEAELQYLVISDLNGDGKTDAKDTAFIRLLLIK